ncbi:MAG: Fic family protein [Bacilli bacterium]
MTFNKIDDLLQQAKKCRPLTMGESIRLRDEFVVDFTYNSNAIEGNTLTLQETALILNEEITIAEKPVKDHLEVIGHKEAYYYVESLVKENIPISEKIIKDIHSIVLMDKPHDKGIYRSVPVRILGAVHTPPQPWEVPIQMEKLLIDYTDMEDKLHPIERIALFHLLFEGVHPFIDGNGRTGRLLLNLELMKDGYPPINVKFADRRKYYDCFTAYHTSGNPAQMVELIAGYVEDTLSRYIEILK